MIILQVFFGDDAVVFCHLSGDLGGYLTFIKPRSPIGGNLFQRIGQIRLLQPVTCFPVFFDEIGFAFIEGSKFIL